MKQSAKEEYWNVLTHGVGALLSVVGLMLLIFYNSNKTSYATLSIWIYGLSAFLLFSISTIYHYVKSVETKNLLRKFDHISIYFLIAGTYTPICLIPLANGIGWYFFWIVWGITAIGIILKLFLQTRFIVSPSNIIYFRDYKKLICHKKQWDENRQTLEGEQPWKPQFPAVH